ncbi:hypothetical protein F5Y04DRAFT_96689 [Hypomontagnella monticulosa]|nr:hypothetical protein F5Y04DRAFT_96689 [Hypomontagnella monticulosa]
MTSIRRVGDRVWFVPQRTSYFYETLPCIDAATSGYTAVAFSIRAPKDASITLEVQTMDNCAASTYNSTYRSVGGFAGRPQRLKIPLDTFQGANMNAVFAFTWSTFDFYSDKNFMWQLADVELVCNCTGHRVAGVEQVCTA